MKPNEDQHRMFTRPIMEKLELCCLEHDSPLMMAMKKADGWRMVSVSTPTWRGMVRIKFERSVIHPNTVEDTDQ